MFLRKLKWVRRTLAARTEPFMARISVASGNHTALVYVNPGSGQNDHLSQDFTV